MAVAWDVNTGTLEVERTGTTDPQTWTHTPAGTLKAVVVAVVHTTSSTDHVSTVTYGGVAMTRKIRATDTATEPGAAELWFLGSGIPTGAQTVSVDLSSATTDDMHFVSMGMTASSDCQTVTTGSVNENAANPSVTLAYGGRTCLSVAALYGGGATAAAFTKNANCTVVQDFSFGANYSVVLRQTSPGSSDFAIGGTASTDDVAYVALAVSELAPAEATPGVGSAPWAGLAPTVQTPNPQTAAPGVGGAPWAGLAPTVAITSNEVAAPGVGAAVWAGLAPTAATTANVSVSPSVGAAAWTGLAPTVQTPQQAAPGVGAATWAGLAPSVQTPESAAPSVGAAVWTGLAPTVQTPQTAAPGVGAAVWAGLAPTVATPESASPGVGAASWSGYAPEVSTDNSTTVFPGVGDGLWAGLAPTVTISEYAEALVGCGACLWEGFAPEATITEPPPPPPRVPRPRPPWWDDPTSPMYRMRRGLAPKGPRRNLGG